MDVCQWHGIKDADWLILFRNGLSLHVRVNWIVVLHLTKVGSWHERCWHCHALSLYMTCFEQPELVFMDLVVMINLLSSKDGEMYSFIWAPRLRVCTYHDTVRCLFMMLFVTLVTRFCFYSTSFHKFHLCVEMHCNTFVYKRSWILHILKSAHAKIQGHWRLRMPTALSNSTDLKLSKRQNFGCHKLDSHPP